MVLLLWLLSFGVLCDVTWQVPCMKTRTHESCTDGGMQAGGEQDGPQASSLKMRKVAESR